MAVKQLVKKKNKQGKSKKSLIIGPVLKFKRLHKDCIRAISYKITKINLKKHDYGLKSLEAGRFNPKQLETARRIITRRVHHKKDKYIIHSKPSWPVTKKARGIRMGKGKGAVHYFTSPISSGSILYQMEGKLGHSKVLKILQKVSRKIPTKAKPVIKKIKSQEIFVGQKGLHDFWLSRE